MNEIASIFDALPPPATESVWAYPETPRIERCARELRVVHSGRTIARTMRGLRLLRTGHPPVYYLPLEDVHTDHLAMSRGRSECPHLGESRALDVVVDGRRSPRAAWTHPQPAARYSALKGHIGFFAGRVDGAFVDGERAMAQPGGVFGGWITEEVVGPFVGAPEVGVEVGLRAG